MNEKINKIKLEMIKELNECILDFLNLVFGKSSETDLFWEVLLTNQIIYDYFGYQIEKDKRETISKGALLFAFLYNTKINLNL